MRKIWKKINEISALFVLTIIAALFVLTITASVGQEVSKWYQF